MKKFSTIASTLSLLIAASFPAFYASPAAADVVKLPKQSGACTFLPDAPDSHVVVKGDTLWDISGRFLKNPWCWPDVWGMNKEEIRNPHWIYPGQVIYLDRVNGRLRLGNTVGGGNGNGNELGATGTSGLKPQIRSQGFTEKAITAIPASIIEPFLVQPLIVEKDDLISAPRIVATEEGRVILGSGDKAYVRGNLKGGTSFQVFRPGKPLKDPETKVVIGYEAVYVGDLKLDRVAKTPDSVDTFFVVKAREEMGVGDRLKPSPPTPIINYVPHPPERTINARIVSIYGGVNQAGQNQVVSINRGSVDGIDLGTVLALSRTGKVIPDPTDGKKPIRLPDENYGNLFVFRIFNNISYGLVMQVTKPVEVGDSAKSPE
jgi:hypothetical protein